jgi:ABC-type uncharacterized transport system ATPase subunit
MVMSSEYAVELEGISKTFPGGVEANKNITLRVKRGEVIGLLGENGAGKSTLMNILYGLLQPDEGTIKINGEVVNLQSPQDAILRGVGMVHQHFKLIPVLTVTENVVLGLEPMRMELDITSIPGGSKLGSIFPINFKSAAKRIEKIGEENSLPVDPNAKIRDLSVGLQQRVEIIKMLYREADILILDEPTSVLTPHEVDELFETLQEFVDAGKTIILITHKLRETMALCDRICVLRDGELVGLVNRDDTSPPELAQMMVGRPVVFRTKKEPKEPGEVILSVKNLTVLDNRKLEKVKGINLEVHAGEIFGIAGVQGNGQTELVEALTGLRKPIDGQVCIKPDSEYEEAHSRLERPIIGYITHGIAFNLIMLFVGIFAGLLAGILLFMFSSLGQTVAWTTGSSFLALFLLGYAGKVNALLGEAIWHFRPNISRLNEVIHGLVITLLLGILEIGLYFVEIFFVSAFVLLGGIGAYILWLILRVFLLAIPVGWVLKIIAKRFSLASTTKYEPCSTPMIDITTTRTRTDREAGMSHIPEDRQKRGLILSFTIEENIALGTHYRPPFAGGPGHEVLALDRIRRTTEDLVKGYSIKLRNTEAAASTLSGGNQQKVVVARELATEPNLVIASQPTRGLDVGATEYIHEVLIGLRDEGVAVLLVSAELDEIQNLSDRIGLIYYVKIVAIKAPGEATPTELGLLMAGQIEDETPEQGVDIA